MVRFWIPLLAIVAGEQPVFVEVGPRVAAVELVLDDATVGRLDEAPWTAMVDLGIAPRVRRLEAIARAADGTELGRATRWLNRPPMANAEDSAAGEVVFVREPIAGETLRKIVLAGEEAWLAARREADDLQAQAPVGGSGQRWTDNPALVEGRLRELLSLGAKTRVALLSTQADEAVAPRQAGGAEMLAGGALTTPRPTRLFATSGPYESEESGGLSWLVVRLDRPALPQRIGDAVCAAGWHAAGSGRKGAVVLILDPAAESGGHFGPAAARSYLADLGVPLVVWTTGDPAAVAEQWGAAESVATWEMLRQAMDRLRRVVAAPEADP